MHETLAVRILTYPIDEAALRRLDNRQRQPALRLHARTQRAEFLEPALAVRAERDGQQLGELPEQAQSVQMWCLLQILAGKLFETWVMLAERILRFTHARRHHWRLLCPDHAASLDWLRDYFGESNFKNNAVKIIRDKTAFHYDGLDLGQAINNLGARENIMHLAEHPANTLYYLGSAVRSRAVFTFIADRVTPSAGRTFDERLSEGLRYCRSRT